MNENVTHALTCTAAPMTYLGELLAISRRHGGELAATVGGVVGAVLATLAVRSWTQLTPLGGFRQVLVILLPAIAAVLLLEAAVTAWRLHRRQEVALATRQTLLDLNTADRAELEQRLLSRYQRRERRIGDRNEARIERLNNEIAMLTAK